MGQILCIRSPPINSLPHTPIAPGALTLERWVRGAHPNPIAFKISPMTVSKLGQYIQGFGRHIMGAIDSLCQHLEDERARWVLWIPVALGIGIGIYFSLAHEPIFSPVLRFGFMALGFVFALMGLLIHQSLVSFLSWAFFWGILGFNLALVRTQMVNPNPMGQSSEPVWIRGVIENIDHPASAHALFQRIVLRITPQNWGRSGDTGQAWGRSGDTGQALPKKAMITIRTASIPLLEGDTIALKAILNPLPRACFPGAHDARRQFFFQGIGASGFALTSPRLIRRQPKILSRWRHTLTRKLHAFLPPPLGAMACGLVTGDKIALPQDIRQDFADSGLSHLLAIAGLHMSILSGLCFMVFQRSLARIPSLALYVNLDRVAAFLSLSIGWLYLMISGQRYPVQRAFFMMSASMLSMLIGRRRHSMRILMLCAATFLILQPESLLALSFQLSFAAVGGLIAVYEWRLAWRYRTKWKPYVKKKGRHIKRFIVDSFWSTGAITVMTLPIMVHHFYHVSLQGFLSNMVAIPFTASVIMPLGLVGLASLNTPFSGIFMGLWGLSLQGLMGIAALSARYGSWMIGWIRPQSAGFFALEMLGICWLLLWRTPWRLWGALVWAIACIAGHMNHVQPTFLIDSDHRLAAYVDAQRATLWVTSLRRGKWSAQHWSHAFGVPHVRLWPPTLEACKASNLPFYKISQSKESKNWSLDLEGHLGAPYLLGPHTGCMMLDAQAQMINNHPNHRPWNPVACSMNHRELP